MSLSEVQQRTQALQARLQMLAGGAPAGGVISSGTTSATTPTFEAALSSATQAAPLPSATTSAPGVSSTGAAAVALARKQLGTPYVWGGEAPGGFDCSGLIQWTYGQLGIDLPRVSYQQGVSGVEVSADQAQPGDLVYYDRPGSVDHIGIYQGNGQWIAAPKTGDVVKIQDIDLSKATSIRRVTGETAPALAGPASPASPAAAWARALPPAAQRFTGLIEQAAKNSGIDPRLLSAVAWTESGFNPSARSGAGAQGLMQIMPRTAEGLGVDALDPAQALKGGATYLSQQLAAFGGRTDLALAAYNAGPTAVRRAGGIPPYAETQAYVDKVMTRYRQLGGTP